jgi:hypothetical protein
MRRSGRGMRAASTPPVSTASAESPATAHMSAATSTVLREGGARRKSENSSRQNDRGQDFRCW